jgi:low temperature requirement protein LtrA
MVAKVVTLLSIAIVVNIHQRGYDYILNYEYLKCYTNLFTLTHIRVELLGMFLLLASCNEFAGTPMEAPYDSSITRAAYRG